MRILLFGKRGQVGWELQRSLAKRHAGLRVVAVTGALADDERRLKVASLAAAPVRVLVATDCLRM